MSERTRMLLLALSYVLLFGIIGVVTHNFAKDKHQKTVATFQAVIGQQLESEVQEQTVCLERIAPESRTCASRTINCEAEYRRDVIVGYRGCLNALRMRREGMLRENGFIK